METHTISERDQRVLGHIKHACASLVNLSPERVADICRFLAILHERYRQVGLIMVAEYFGHTLNMHFLHLLATAHDEGSSQALARLDQLGKPIIVQSFEHLERVIRLTSSMTVLSETDAEDGAMMWQAKLPTLYCQELDQILASLEVPRVHPRERDEYFRNGAICFSPEEIRGLQTGVGPTKHGRLLEPPHPMQGYILRRFTVAAQDQQIIERIQSSCSYRPQITPERIAAIVTYITSWAEPHQQIALNLIARYLVSTMKMHILSLMATFQQKADEEEIIPRHCEEALGDFLLPAFNTLNDLSERVFIPSIDKLYTIAHITGCLQTLSETNSAWDAQNALYRYSGIYASDLDEEQLLTGQEAYHGESAELEQKSLQSDDPLPIPTKGTSNGVYQHEENISLCDKIEERSRLVLK